MSSNADSPARPRLYGVRDQVVILDVDVAAFFERTVKSVNQTRSRNAARFPDDYAFQLSQDEWDFVRSQTVTAKRDAKRRAAPWAYTEHDFVMLAMSFRGDQADRIARVVTDTFIAHRRGTLPNTPVLSGPDTAKRRNSLRAQIMDMMEGIASMPLPSGNSAIEELESSTAKALDRVRAWLDQPKLENAKVDAEIAKLAADTRKAYAEIEKMDAETANIWADTVLKRLTAVQQLRAMAAQIDRDDVGDVLEAQFDPAQAIMIAGRGAIKGSE